MKNKVAELIGVMVRFPKAQAFFQDGWLALYNDIMQDPLARLADGESDEAFNRICGMALLDWYESEEGL